MPESMRDLAQRLRGDNAEAFAELLEFSHAILTLSRCAEDLAAASGEVVAASERLIGGGEMEDSAELIRLLHDRATNLDASAIQLVAAMREMRAGVDRWRLLEQPEPD